MQALRLAVTMLAHRLRSERGATFVEYAFLLACVAIAVTAAVFAVGGSTFAFYDDAQTFFGS